MLLIHGTAHLKGIVSRTEKDLPGVVRVAAIEPPQAKGLSRIVVAQGLIDSTPRSSLTNSALSVGRLAS
jgi:hypothetical protein